MKGARFLFAPHFNFVADALPHNLTVRSYGDSYLLDPHGQIVAGAGLYHEHLIGDHQIFWGDVHGPRGYSGTTLDRGDDLGFTPGGSRTE